jgi:hypothetical protein
LEGVGGVKGGSGHGIGGVGGVRGAVEGAGRSWSRGMRATFWGFRGGGRRGFGLDASGLSLVGVCRFGLGWIYG